MIQKLNSDKELESVLRIKPNVEKSKSTKMVVIPMTTLSAQKKQESIKIRSKMIKKETLRLLQSHQSRKQTKEG